MTSQAVCTEMNYAFENSQVEDTVTGVHSKDLKFKGITDSLSKANFGILFCMSLLMNVLTKTTCLLYNAKMIMFSILKKNVLKTLSIVIKFSFHTQVIYIAKPTICHRTHSYKYIKTHKKVNNN